MVEADNRARQFITELSKRLIRSNENDEAGAFVRWISRKPFIKDWRVNNLMVTMDQVKINDWDDEGEDE